MSFVGNVTKALSVHKRKLGAVGIVAGRSIVWPNSSLRYFTLTFPGLVGLQYAGYNPFGKIMRTPGVKSVEDRYTSAGGSPTNLPGAATPLGRSDLVTGNTALQQGVGTEKFAKTEGEQKPPVSAPGML